MIEIAVFRVDGIHYAVTDILHFELLEECLVSVVTSKGQIIPEFSGGVEEFICKLTLSEQGLIIERDEYMKEAICLYEIALKDILEFDFINKQQQKKSILKTVGSTLAGIIGLIFVGVGYIRHASKAPDILVISFKNNGEIVRLVFNMMEYGEKGLTKKYRNLVGDYI